MTGQRPGEAEAHKALHDRYGIGPCVLGGNCPIAGDLDAAYPIIAAAVAEQIAQRIEQYRMDELDWDISWALAQARDFAREYGKEVEQ